MKSSMLIFLFLPFIQFGQEIKYSFFLKDPCSGKVESALLYYLEKDGKKYHVNNFLNDRTEIILPSEGKYRLVSTSLGETHDIVINKEHRSDTLTLPKISEYHIRQCNTKSDLTSKPTSYSFMSCGQKCNGIQTDYYSDGLTIRLQGEFKDGLVVGQLEEFNQDGSIKKLSIYDNSGHFVEAHHYVNNKE